MKEEWAYSTEAPAEYGYRETAEGTRRAALEAAIGKAELDADPPMIRIGRIERYEPSIGVFSIGLLVEELYDECDQEVCPVGMGDWIDTTDEEDDELAAALLPVLKKWLAKHVGKLPWCVGKDYDVEEFTLEEAREELARMKEQGEGHDGRYHQGQGVQARGQRVPS